MTNDEPPAAQPIILRSALPQDDLFLLQVYASTRADELALVRWSEEQKNLFIQMQFQAQRQHYRTYFPGAEYSVIWAGDQRPLGRLIVDRSGAEIRLMDIALLPEARGQGTGTALIQALQKEAGARGKPLRLHVETGNRARRLYERLGFAVCGEEGVHVEMEWRPPAQLSKAFFAARLFSRFRLRADSGESAALELIELLEGSSGPRLEQFSILFRGAGPSLLPQKTYTLEQDAGGAFDLFLVPVGRDEQGTYYEAVFNNLIPAKESSA